MSIRDLPGSVAALSGGVGGAKLAFGLSRALGPALTVVVNTGDDFEHLGLRISPDIDSVIYALSGLSDEERGWGRAGETWQFMEALKLLDGEAWFQLGDKDLAMHVERTHRLASGETLTKVTGSLARRLGIKSLIVPTTDGPLATTVVTEDGTLPFQRYFVEQRCAPVVKAIHFDHTEYSPVTQDVLRALAAPDLAAVILCPSNPYLSIDPILAVPGMRAALGDVHAPVIAISPIIGGQAIKGPTTKIMSEIGVPATNEAIARHYKGLIDALVIDLQDVGEAPCGVEVHATSTLMRSLADRDRLANEVLDFAARLSNGHAAKGTRE